MLQGEEREIEQPDVIDYSHLIIGVTMPEKAAEELGK